MVFTSLVQRNFKMPRKALLQNRKGEHLSKTGCPCSLFIPFLYLFQPVIIHLVLAHLVLTVFLEVSL